MSSTCIGRPEVLAEPVDPAGGGAGQKVRELALVVELGHQDLAAVRAEAAIASSGSGESITTFIAAQRMPSARALSIASSASPKVEPQAITPTSTLPSSPKRFQVVRSA